jgi:hypothetical protein
MNSRDAYRAALAMEHKKPRKETEESDENRHITPRREKNENDIEDNLAKAIDNKNTILRILNVLDRLERTKDVQGAIQDIAPDVFVDLVILAKEAKGEKVKLAAIQDLLDRAGYGKVTKHAVARFNASDSKEAIISSILGTKKDLSKIGIEITDDDQDKQETAREPDDR